MASSSWSDDVSDEQDDRPRVIDGALDRYLVPGEQVIVETRLHWIVHAKATLIFAICVLIAVRLSTVADPTQLVKSTQRIAAAAVVISLAWLLNGIFNWTYEWWVATDRRFLYTHGIMGHKVAMMPLAKVTDLTFERTLMGLAFGYGYFIVESAGQDQAMARIGPVPDPEDAQSRVSEVLFPGRHETRAGRQGEAPPDSGPGRGGPGPDGGGWDDDGWGGQGPDDRAGGAGTDDEPPWRGRSHGGYGPGHRARHGGGRPGASLYRSANFGRGRLGDTGEIPVVPARENTGEIPTKRPGSGRDAADETPLYPPAHWSDRES